MMPQDMIQLFQMIDVDYPNNQIAKSIEDRRVSIARWFQRLSNHEANKVFAAYEVYLARSPKFAPNWQDLVQILAERQNGLVESADVAWGKLMRAVSAFGWSQKGRARKELGERIWKIVENFDWMHYCNMPMDSESTYYAQFRSSYDAQIKRETEQAQVPPAAAAVLDRIGQKISTIDSDSIDKKS